MSAFGTSFWYLRSTRLAIGQLRADRQTMPCYSISVAKQETRELSAAWGELSGMIVFLLYALDRAGASSLVGSKIWFGGIPSLNVLCWDNCPVRNILLLCCVI